MKTAVISLLAVLGLVLCLGNTKCGAGLNSSGGSSLGTSGSGPVIFYGGKPGTLVWKGLGVAHSGPHAGKNVWVELGTAALAGAVTGTAAAQAAANATGTPVDQINAAASSAATGNPCPPGAPKYKVVEHFPNTTPGTPRNVLLKCGGFDRFRTGRVFRRSDLKKCIQNILNKGGYREGRPNTTEPAHQYALDGNGFAARMSVTANGTIASIIFRRGNLVRCANA